MPDADIKRVKFLDFLQKEIARRGVIDVLRKGVRYYPSSLIMFYATPTEKNDQAKLLFEQNIFSVTRQLQYSNIRGKSNSIAWLAHQLVGLEAVQQFSKSLADK